MMVLSQEEAPSNVASAAREAKAVSIAVPQERAASKAAAETPETKKSDICLNIFLICYQNVPNMVKQYLRSRIVGQSCEKKKYKSHKIHYFVFFDIFQYILIHFNIF